MAALGSVGSFADADNGGAPLALTVDGSATAGTPDPLHRLDPVRRSLRGRRRAHRRGPSPKKLASDDAELELGWTVGLPGDTATSGLWEYGDPVGTVYNGAPSNPENDATRRPPA